MGHHVGCVHEHLNHGTEEKQANRDHACKLKTMDSKENAAESCRSILVCDRKKNLVVTGHVQHVT